MSNIFEKRVEYKPFEYPGVMKFIDAINKSFWVHSEVDFTADIQDYNINLTEQERECITRALLLIAQTEVAVKTFWGDLYKHFPKPEFNGLGSTFAECEFRHSEAYSRLLTVTGNENKFKDFIQSDLIKERLEVFSEFLTNKTIEDKLLYFTIIVENTSLFTQFATILSFTRFRGQLKNIANIISWTSIDEQIHANAGIWILNQIKKENVELSNLDSTFSESIKEIIEQEDKVVDYIFEKYQSPFFSIQNMKDFMRYRVDEALKQLNLPTIFNITNEQYKPMHWFEEEVFSNSLDDFFSRRPVDYTKHDKVFTGDDLF